MSAPERGVGLIYRGSLEEMHGARVVSMGDCGCTDCQFRPRGRVVVEVELFGLRDRMYHARLESFVTPD